MPQLKSHTSVVLYEQLSKGENTMSQIVEHGQAIITDVVHFLDLVNETPDAFTLSPITEEGKDVHVGLQYLYQTTQTPPTRLQITFGDRRLNLVAPGGPLHSASVPCRKGQLRSDWVSQYDTHPDPKVKAQVLELLALLEAEGYEGAAIAWETEFEMMDKEIRDDLAGTAGFFFPMLYFYNATLDYDVVVRCEPVVELTTEQ